MNWFVARLGLAVGLAWAVLAQTPVPESTNNAPTETAADRYSGLSIKELLHVIVRLQGRGIFFGPVAEPEPDTIRIGVLVPLAKYPEYGRQIIDSAELAAYEINSAGGLLGHRLAIIRADDTGDPTLAAELTKTMIENFGIVALVGPTQSDRTIHVAKTTTIPAGVLLVTPDATSVDIAQLDDHNLVWRTAPSDRLQAFRAAEVAVDTLGSQRVAVVFLRNLFGEGLKDIFVADVRSRGAEVVAELGVSELVDYSEYDLKSSLDELFAAQPQALYLITTGVEAAAITRQIERHHYLDDLPDFHLLACNDVKHPSFLLHCSRSVSEGLLVTTPAATFTTAFANRYRAAYGIVPEDSGVGHAYDAVILIAYAIEAAKSSVPEEFALRMASVARGEVSVSVGEWARGQKALHEGGSVAYTGAAGAIRFDANGDNVGAEIEIAMLRNGAFTRVDEATLKSQ